MAELIIRPRQRESDDARIVELRNTIDPEYPPSTVERYRFGADEGPRPEGTREARFVGVCDGEILGYAFVSQMWGVTRPDGYFARIDVDPGRRGQGIGSRLYQHLVEVAQEFGAGRLVSVVREDRPQDHQFAERRGFAETGRSDRESRLHVPDANLEGCKGLTERLAREGIRIVALAELDMDDESIMRRYHEMTTAAWRDVPSSEELTGMPYDLWRQGFLSWPGASAESYWVAIDGDRPIGTASLDRKDERSAGNGFTAVDRAYRGKGIARALKLRSIEWARDNGIEYIYTDNDIDNRRMLDINIRLGYQPIPSYVEVAKDMGDGGVETRAPKAYPSDTG